MKILKIISVAAPCALLAGLAGSTGKPAELRWPVHLDRAISSSFCEYRDGRFHAGIDVRTFGRQGVPCVALADGWISRIRAGSRGYGKALHLTIGDSLQVVYGHLSEYIPALEDTLYAAQMIDTTYAVDFRPPAGRFRVQAGDTIAWSGMTGTTAPHVHLELRDMQDRPIDPFTTGLALPDRLRPEVSRLVFVPLSARARVAGRCLPWGVATRRAGVGHVTLPDTVRIFGRVAVAVVALDRVNTESGRLAPHAFAVYADDSLRARIELNRFSFDRSGEVDHLYNASLLRARGVRLFQIWDVGDSPFDTRWVDGGALPQDSTRAHHGRVRVSDAAGNVTDVDFVFVCGAAPAEGRDGSPARRDLAVDLDDAYFQDGFARIAARSGGDDAQVLEAGQLGSAVQRLAAYADRDSAGVWVAGVRAGEARTLRFPAQGLRVQIPRDAVTADAVVYVRGADSFGRSLEGMTRLTRPVRLGPVGWVLHAPLEVHLDMEHPGRGEAVYRYDDYRRSWSYLASDMDSAGWTAKSDRPGVFAVFRDTAAPRLGRPSLAHVRSWATGAVWREIHIPIDDAGSGFDEARTRVRVGGARHIFRWDFVGKKLIVPLRDDSIIGQQSVRVVAFDRSGNRSTRDAVVDTGSR